ncbi:hypothetical protein, partial [Paenibacillus dendritiformis]|uniref:hypothetical protein n=1 Tax=Paenibacillus dendritiformis TaxID=130049 RepID=UPI001B2FE352
SWSFADFACRMGVSREMVQFSSGRNIHFPAQNFFLNSLIYAGFAVSPALSSKGSSSFLFTKF